MDKKYILHLTFEINHRKCVCLCVCVCVWGGGGVSCSFLTYQEASLTTLFHTQNVTFHQSFEYLGIYYINTISNQITGIYWPHKKYFMTSSPLTYVTNGIHDVAKCCIKSWLHLDLRPDNMLFGGLT